MLLPHFIALLVVSYYSCEGAVDVKLHNLKDARLCNNVEVGHVPQMCKWESNVYPCDQRKITPEQCKIAVVESDPFSMEEIFAALPAIDGDINVRRIAIQLKSTEKVDVSALGEQIDNFLKARLWWYVTKEPYAWTTHGLHHAVVLSRVQHQFEPTYRVISALQFPLTPEICEKSAMLLHHHDFKHPGWYSMIAQYTIVHHDYPNSVTAVYVSSENLPTDSTSFISAQDCPKLINKWECAFLPTTNCTIPEVVTHCKGTNCVIHAVQDISFSSAMFDSAGAKGQVILQGSPPYNAVKAKTHADLAYNAQYTQAVAMANKAGRPGTSYGKPFYPEKAPFQGMMINDFNEYMQTQGLMLRHSAFYRSRIADTIHHFYESTGLTVASRCVAAQIRRGDRANPGLNLREFCLKPENRDSDYGCASVPYGLVTLQHVIDSAETLVEPSVRNLFVTTDDEAWLDAERVKLTKTHPEWHVYSLKTPNHTHIDHKKEHAPNENDYEYMRYGAGTQR